ncbi:DUF3037 domain-containing protein [Deinococcus radiomollis]|uniref:DUF3037 domain-containing protein n=1 Tax=Deinococcus radiomollis TaxID=468916 RepID=UPI0038918A31
MTAAFYEEYEAQLRDAYYSVVRFVPDQARGEQVNVAVILEAPESGFLAVKARKNMTRLLKNLAPHIDERIVYDFAKGLEDDFSARPERHIGERLFPATPAVRYIDSLKSFLEDSPRSIWTASKPQHMVVHQSVRWIDEINHLYAMFLANYKGVQTETWDKSRVQAHSYSHLRKQEITLNLAPEPIHGETYDNDFDASYSVDEMRGFFQFFTYDSSEPDLNQMIRFLSSVEDSRDSGVSEANGNFFVPVIKPPTTPSAKVKFDKATTYCAKKKVRWYTTSESDLDQIAHAFKERDKQLLTRI